VPSSCCVSDDVTADDVMISFDESEGVGEEWDQSDDYLCQLQAVQLQFPRTVNRDLSSIKTTVCYRCLKGRFAFRGRV